jgi:adenosine deaminase
VVEAVVAGFSKGALDATGGIAIGEVGGLVGGVIICALRTNPPEHGVAMAELAGSYLGKGIIGWDLAADEGAHPLSKHLPGLRRAIELGVPTTVHAGEWGSGAKSESNPHLFAQVMY